MSDDAYWLQNNSWVHPQALLRARARLGRFCIIERDCQVGADTVIGDYCKLMPGSVLGEGVRFDDYANTSGAVVLGDEVMVKRQACVTQGLIAEHKAFIGPGVMVIHEQHVSWKRPGVTKLSRGIWIGAGAVVGGAALLLPGVEIGHNAWVAAGALVTRDCDPCGIYVGRPAKKVGEVPEPYHVNPNGPPLSFAPEILEEYLPELVAVGRQEFR